jgi:DNA-binding NarL/FixJ family response regulator
MTHKIHLMLVEDSPEYRETITMAVAKETDIELVSQFGTAEEALRVLQSTASPDLILLDLNLPGISGTDALPWFKKYAPETKIIVLTQSNKEADVLAAISAGASGYLLKGSTRRQIFDGVRTVMNGGAMIDPEIAIYILNTLKARPTESDPGKALSARELEILVLLGDGMVQKEISRHLDITSNTVATHIRRIYEKLEVQNAPAAISKAYRSGILPFR